MKSILFYILLLNSCVTTEYHAASPLTKANGLNIKALNKYKVDYECPKDEDQLLCTYANTLLTDRGYITELDEGKKARPPLNIQIKTTKVKDYGSGTFDFVLWILRLRPGLMKHKSFSRLI